MTAWPNTPQDSSASWLARDDQVLGQTLNRVFDVVAESAQGSWIVDVDGRRYLDFTCGIGVTSIGHCHPKVVDAIKKQAAQLMHTSVVVHHKRAIELAERLRLLTPWMPEAQAFFCNSGAEAVEGALKMARRVTGKAGVIAFRGAFHGRTLGATSLTTSKGWYRKGYEPLLPGVHIASYPNTQEGNDVHITAENALEELDRILTFQAPDPAIGIIIVEPVLGEGGYVPAPREFLEGLRVRADEHGILLCFDEVQTGVGRTGAFFSAERYGVFPDVVLFAKGIASGMPLGGLVARRELFEQWPKAQHGTTFGGNPVSCAAAIATLDVIEQEGLSDRARVLGEELLEKLRAISSEQICNVRGMGLMIGIQLDNGEAVSRVQRRCFKEGMLVLACGPNDEVIRLLPPLNISAKDFDLGFSILERVLS